MWGGGDEDGGRGGERERVAAELTSSTLAQRQRSGENEKRRETGERKRKERERERERERKRRNNNKSATRTNQRREGIEIGLELINLMGHSRCSLVPFVHEMASPFLLSF